MANITLLQPFNLDSTQDFTFGNVTATGNVNGNYFIGNGSQLTGISANSFGTITVDGQSNIVASSGNTALNLVAGNSIVLTTDPLANTVTIAYGQSGAAIFATGGSMGTIVESVTESIQLGTITDLVITAYYNLGSLGVDGVVTNDSIANGTIQGEKLAANITISTTGNIIGGGVRSTTATTPPTSPPPVPGDIWYDSSTDVMYRYTYDGTSSYWIDEYGSTAGLTGAAASYYVANGTSNIVIATNGNAVASIGGTSNVWVTTSSAFIVNGNLSATGNITGGNISGTLTGPVSVTANITGGNLNATGLSLSGNVVSNLNVTGNVTGGNLNATGLSLSGNVVSNVTVEGAVSATGDISTSTAVSGQTIVATNGIFVNNTLIAQSQTIDTGTNGFSVGPMTLQDGATLTIAAGQRHIII